MDTNCNYPPSHMKNQNYQINSGKNINNNNNNNNNLPMHHKETCAGCGRPIEDRYLLRVMDNSWHEACLQCNVCGEHLTRSCYVKDRKLFCKTDYDQLFGAKCKRCLQSIPSNELVMRALGNVYHLRCFSCIVCGHQLQKGDQFVLKDGQLFCRLDFEKEFTLMPLSPKSEFHFVSGGVNVNHMLMSSDEDSSVEDNESDGGKGPKRPRTILTTSQRRKFKASFEINPKPCRKVRILKFKASFEINPKPCRKVRETLAAETGLSVRVVQVWFQNQRAKVKKLARRQNQDGTIDNRKSSSRSKKGKKEQDNDDEPMNPDQGMPGLQPLPPQETQYGGLRSYDQTHSHSPIYGSQPMSESMYNSDSSIGLEGSLDNLDDMLTPHTPVQNGQPSLINPIDKLYSMQTSYFSTE
ncbi:LIM homeobox transcription factor 1-beta-like isoform X2 [Lineus longissimus]|uniref:LIM homeobox transcription factor 1-beta-like isoform X2 n=1 Tax=Lineus longissimus TaxID=88925 RepID=UPI00315DD614